MAVQVRVYIPGPLRSYTKERAEVSLELAEGASLRRCYRNWISDFLAYVLG